MKKDSLSNFIDKNKKWLILSNVILWYVAMRSVLIYVRIYKCEYMYLTVTTYSNRALIYF